VCTGTTSRDGVLGALPEAPECAPYRYVNANCWALTFTTMAFDGASLTVPTWESV